MATLYCLNYNNYYNRIIKSEPDLSSYLQYVVGEAIPSANFNPNDGVNTEQIIGNGEAIWDISPDYLLVVDNIGNIISRWFILDAIRTRNNQYKLTLQRDLFADYYENIIDADTFIEKGYVSNLDTRIYNDEGIQFNQIKKQEYFLKDTTDMPWIVGYCSKDAFQNGEVVNINSGISYSSEQADETVNSLADLEGYIGTYYVNTPGAITYSTAIKEGSALSNTPWHIFKTKVGVITNNPLSSGTSGIANGYLPGYQESGNVSNAHLKRITNAANNAINNLSTTYNDYLFELFATESWIVEQNGKTIFDDATQKLYKIVVKDLGVIEGERQILTQGTSTWTALDNSMRSNEFINVGVSESPVWYYQYTGKQYEITYVEVGDIVKSSITFPTGDVRQHTVDAPYDVFCIPAGGKEFGVKIGETFKYGRLPDIEGAIQLASKFAEMAVGTNTKVYDIQLVPYCPFNARVQFTAGDIEIIWSDVGNLTKTENRDYNVFLDEVGNPVSVLTWCSNATGTLNINLNLANPTTAIETKVMNQCDMWRLCSPNWNGQFEFNVAKNNGMYGINVDYCYKPYQPYIHLNPNFGGLYGRDFNDARGLICGGDFSLTQFSDAFVNYQMSNKNFQEIFDRQISNMETTQEIQRKQQIWGAVAGGLSGISSGAMAGGFLGGLPGGIAGGIAGGLLSAGGAIGDIAYSDILRNEQLSYTKDIHDYQIGNIKATPDSLTKVSSYNPNNKIFPVLEYYSCTEEEKNAFREQLKFGGMTVKRIGKIKDYINSVEKTFVKGTIIKLDISEDYHIANAIAQEVNKGGYF